MKPITSIQRVLAVSSLSILGLLAPASVHAVQLTYDMRIVSDSQGDTITDPYHVTATVPGEVFTVNIYASVKSLDSDHTNDGFQLVLGSFQSIGALQGSMRGDTTQVTSTNNVSAFTSAVTQSGFVSDIDGDGDLDVGTLVTTAGPSPAPWFVANSSSSTSPVFGTGSGTGNTDFLIGTTTFTLSPGASANQQTSLHFAPRVRLDGGPSGKINDRFVVDGAAINVNGNDASIGENDAVVTFLPEPSAFGMLALGAMGLVGFRRATFRRSLA